MSLYGYSLIAAAALAGSWAGDPAPASPAQGQAPPAAQVDLKAEFDALVERFESAQRAFYEKLNELYKDFDESKASQAEKDELQRKATELYKQDPSPEFAVEFEKLAEKARGQELAADIWMKVIELSNGPESRPRVQKALKALLGEHIAWPGLESLGSAIGAWSVGEELFVSTMTTLREKSPHAKVQASASFSLASHYLGSGKAEQAKLLFRELMEKHAATEAQWGGSYGQKAERALFEAEHLQIGMVAPDFESIDETGAKFKVSDYRGKVVVLDFWGYW